MLEWALFFGPKSHIADFEAAAMPHLADLYRSARYLVRNSTDAQDLVQEVYLEAWKSFHRFEAGTNCRAWLFKIMFHRLSHLRRQFARTSKVVLFASLAEQENVVAEPPVPQDIRDDDILLALERLPMEFREVVLMADVEDFSYKEIAGILKIPLGTVMSRLSRGRRLLREALAGLARNLGILPAEERGGESA